MNNCIFCHIRYCDSVKETPMIKNFHDDWALLNHITLRDLTEEEYLDALELLL